MSISWKKFIHFFFFFLALDLISGLDSFVKMEAYCYLGEGTEGGKSQNYELKGGCAVKLTARTVSPGASIARTIFVVSFCEPWSGEFILWGCVPIAARKKKKKDGRQTRAAVYFMVTALCGCVMLQSLVWDIDPLFLWIKPQCVTGEGRLQKRTNFCKIETLHVVLPITDLIVYRKEKSIWLIFMACLKRSSCI